MRKIICDRCGKEIFTDRIGYVAINWRARSDDSLIQANRYENCDFCEHCMREITEVIDFIDTAPDVVEAKPEAVEATVVELPEAVNEVLEDGSDEDQDKDPDEDEAALWEDEEEEPEPEPDPPPVVKKGVNYTKLRELVKSGKKPQEISAELGITMKQYYYARKRAEQLYVAGRI